MKITGAEFKEWHDTAWPDGYIWCEDTIFTTSEGEERDIFTEDSTDDNTQLTVADAETFVIPDWWSIQFEDSVLTGKNCYTVRSLIRRWRKERSTSTFVVTVPKDDAEIEALKAFVAGRQAKGWKVVG